MLPLVIIEGLVIVLLAVLVAGLLRSHAEILRSLDALGAGEPVSTSRPSPRPSAGSAVPVEAITGATPQGGVASVALTGQPGYVLLAFLSTGCLSCQTFWESLGGEVELPASEVRPVIVTRGADGESPSEVARMAPRGVTTLMSTDAWDSFRVPGSPFFQLIDATRGLSVGEGSAGSWSQMVDLMRRSLADASHRDRSLRLTTRERLRDSGDELRQAGIQPGDPSLHRNPLPPTSTQETP
jgi:hypothetical protein